jgi:hypothetical protein
MSGLQPLLPYCAWNSNHVTRRISGAFTGNALLEKWGLTESRTAAGFLIEAEGINFNRFNKPIIGF